ncbi:hypothetical protein SAMN05421736_10892 [Evansella caseinilytica]|uniref:Uncharacterized protein n=1 Tax=Evansella caseinilytica TaxID=1503961 RepID=A0A1H3RIH3_9BACI|nr:hypothetical protein [Evansella caseinilytica]SDZ24739.1 hypothetical protein SAMN05421736_10892 [Evansella caseinilytica]
MKKMTVSFLLITVTFFMLAYPFTAAADSGTSDSITSENATMDDMPEFLRPSVEWVYHQRMIPEGTPGYPNLIFDQIICRKWNASLRGALAVA